MQKEAVLIGLPDEEIRRLAALPLRSKAERFAPAKKWYEENGHYLHKSFPGQYVCVNPATLKYSVGLKHKEITAEHKATLEGTDLLIIWIGHSVDTPRA